MQTGDQGKQQWFVSSVIVLTMLLTPMLIDARTRSTELEYFKLVQPPGIQGQQLLYIPFDREIYKFSEKDFSDVRIFDSHGTDIPRVVRQYDEITGMIPAAVNVVEDTDNQKTIIDVQMNREPVTGFVIGTESADFQRTATVMIPGVEEHDAVASADIYHRSDDEEAEMVLVQFDEQRSMSFRITIDNNGQAPLDVKSILYEGPAYQLVFKGIEGESYQLFWGSSSVGAPAYNVSELEELISQGASMRRARVGRGFSNPQYSTGTVSDTETDTGSAWLLVPLVAVIVLILAFAFIKSGKQREQG
jgi:hypothetical protein